ncbi:MAG: transporter associated domain-containing protein [Peptoniphilus sp.]|nr:transporter associated domain-containing protein [Peptoniphilus sp.]
MDRKKFMLYLNKAIFAFEVLISVMLIVGIIISIPDILKYYIKILQNDVEVSAILFNNFLSHVLMIVIAMEFILLLVTQTDATTVHLVTLVIARKMLIKSDDMLDILLGVIAITILFVTRKFLSKGTSSTNMKVIDNEKVFSGASEIEEINRIYNYRIDPEDSVTIGGLVSKLLHLKGMEIKEGQMIEDNDYIYEIKKVSKGLIEEVSIHKISKNE